MVIPTTAPEAPRSLDPIVQWISYLNEQWPLVGLLLLLMALDVLVGFCAAFITKTISSTICSRGMMKKVVILAMVGMCTAIEPHAQGLPLSKLAAMFFIVFECTSILENAARTGLPVPSAITDTLVLLKGADKQKASVTTPQSQVTIARATNVDIHAETVEPKKPDSVVVKATELNKPV